MSVYERIECVCNGAQLIFLNFKNTKVNNEKSIYISSSSSTAAGAVEHVALFVPLPPSKPHKLIPPFTTALSVVPSNWDTFTSVVFNESEFADSIAGVVCSFPCTWVVGVISYQLGEWVVLCQRKSFTVFQCVAVCKPDVCVSCKGKRLNEIKGKM